MTKITFYYDEQGTLRGIESRGHSGYSEQGSDIICAATSSLMHALLLGLTDVAQVQKLKCKLDPKGPVMRIMWPRECARELELLTRTIALSLKAISEDYPVYVKVNTKIMEGK